MENAELWWAGIVFASVVFAVVRFLVRGSREVKSFVEERKETASIMKMSGEDIKELGKTETHHRGEPIPIEYYDSAKLLPQDFIEAIYFRNEGPLPVWVLVGVNGIVLTPSGHGRKLLAAIGLVEIAGLEELGASGIVVHHHNNTQYKLNFKNGAQRDLWLNTMRNLMVARNLSRSQADRAANGFAYPLYMEKFQIGKGKVVNANGEIICRTPAAKFEFPDGTLRFKPAFSGLTLEIINKDKIHFGKLVRNKKFLPDVLTLSDASDTYVATVTQENPYLYLISHHEEVVFRIYGSVMTKFIMLPVRPVTLSRDHERLILIGSYTQLQVM